MVRTVIVTGGLGGIGLAVARRFASNGDAIVLADRRVDQDACETLRAKGAAGVSSIECDVGDEDAVEAAAAHAIERFGSLDVIVNVAGAMQFKSIAEFSADDWRVLLNVNLIGSAMFVREGFRRMKSGGAIVNIASVHARRTSANVAPYAAAKAALVSLTRSAAIEGKPLGIRVNAILPGAIDTPMLTESPNIKSGAEIVDPKDVGSPDDIAQLAFFLASDLAQFITGEDVVADGGRMGRL